MSLYVTSTQVENPRDEANDNKSAFACASAFDWATPDVAPHTLCALALSVAEACAAVGLRTTPATTAAAAAVSGLRSLDFTDLDGASVHSLIFSHPF